MGRVASGWLSRRLEKQVATFSPLVAAMRWRADGGSMARLAASSLVGSAVGWSLRSLAFEWTGALTGCDQASVEALLGRPRGER